MASVGCEDIGSVREGKVGAGPPPRAFLARWASLA